MHRSLSRSTIVVLIVAAVLTAVVAILELGQIGTPEPLVSTEGWTAPDKIRPLEFVVSNIPQEIQSHPKFSLWSTWTPLGTVKGVITSPPFKASRYLAVPFQIGGERGYPDSDRVTLHCNASGAEMPVTTSQSLGGEWNVAYIQVPSAFCGSDVQIIASSNAAHADYSYVGVGTAFSVSRALYLAHSGFGAKALVVAGTWLLFGSIFLAGALCARGRIDRFGAGGLAIGVAGMVVFLGGTVSAWGARAAAVGCVIVAFFVILRAVITDRDSTASNARENGILGRTVWTSAHSEPYRDVRQFQKLSQPVRLCDGPGQRGRRTICFHRQSPVGRRGAVDPAGDRIDRGDRDIDATDL